MSELSPLVSIVTPSYNQGKFLEKTILSVLGQTYSSIEYIVIDGGSTDNSVDIIRKYEDRISFWLSEKDRGQSQAINKGWLRAKGSYCSYLNSDDLLQPDAVAKIVDAFSKNPDAGVVYGDSTFIDEKGQIIEQAKGTPCDFKKLLIDGQGPYIVQPSSFYSTASVRKAGYIDENLHLSMDYDLLLKLAKNSKMMYIPEPISLFRLHSNAKSSTLAIKHWHESLKIKARYSKFYLLPSLFFYLRFRIFHLLPLFIQNALRKKRNSINDRMFFDSAK